MAWRPSPVSPLASSLLCFYAFCGSRLSRFVSERHGRHAVDFLKRLAQPLGGTKPTLGCDFIHKQGGFGYQPPRPCHANRPQFFLKRHAQMRFEQRTPMRSGKLELAHEIFEFQIWIAVMIS